MVEPNPNGHTQCDYTCCRMLEAELSQLFYANLEGKNDETLEDNGGPAHKASEGSKDSISRGRGGP